jgi:hypothetical protein
MTLVWSQPLTEMITRNVPGGKGWLVHKADNSLLTVSKLSRKFVSLDISQTQWACAACYKNSFFYQPMKGKEICPLLIH